VVSQDLEKRRHGYQFAKNLKRRVLEQRRDGYPFGKNLRKKSHDILD
jgi:hypothetical protein